MATVAISVLEMSEIQKRLPKRAPGFVHTRNRPAQQGADRLHVQHASMRIVLGEAK